MSRRYSCPLRVAQSSPSTSELTRPQPGPSIDIAIAMLLTEDRTHRSIQSTVLVSPCPRMSSTLPRGSREHPNHHWHLPRKYTKNHPSIPLNPPHAPFHDQNSCCTLSVSSFLVCATHYSPSAAEIYLRGWRYQTVWRRCRLGKVHHRYQLSLGKYPPRLLILKNRIYHREAYWKVCTR
jgi:hypothetical protein